MDPDLDPTLNGGSGVRNRVSQTPFLSGFKLLRSFSHPIDLKKAPHKISGLKVKFYRFPQALFFCIVYPNSKIWPKPKTGYNSSKMPQIRKIRTLLQFELKKFEKTKLSYFFHLGPFWPFFGQFLVSSQKRLKWP